MITRSADRGRPRHGVRPGRVASPCRLCRSGARTHTSEPGSDLDEVLWQAWKAMDLPEGYRAEIIEGAIEVASPGHRNPQRDRVRRRREYARAGIPVYVIVDDFDDDGAVTVLTSPDGKKATYADEHRVPYGTDAVIPEGPAKGFAIGKEIVAS